MNLFRNIYSWFKGLYGNNLYDYLAGKDCNGDSLLANQFDGVIGWVVLAIVVVSAITFYFVPFPNMGRKWKWFVAALSVSMLSWLFGFGYSSYEESDMPDYVVYGVENCYISETEEYADDSYSESDYEDSDYDEDVEADATDMGGGCNDYVHYDDAVQLIKTSNFLGFGLASAIIAFCFFFILSMVFARIPKASAYKNPL